MIFSRADDWLNVSVTNSLAQILGEIDKNQLEEADDAIDEAGAVGTSEDSLGAGEDVPIVGANRGRRDDDDDDVDNGGSRGDDNDYSGTRASTTLCSEGFTPMSIFSSAAARILPHILTNSNKKNKKIKKKSFW